MRLLHPASKVNADTDPLTWRAVAAWSGIRLEATTQFHEIAIPERSSEGTPPLPLNAPLEGTLHASHAQALVEILARHTSATDRCWFCLWDGYGWEGTTALSSDSSAPRLLQRVPDPIPPTVLSGERVALPSRNYFLYEGPISAALNFVDSKGQTPNLWWPEDHSWCIASEIDLPWTYVGGSTTLVSDIEADQRVEAQLTSKDATFFGTTTDWLPGVFETAIDHLLDSGNAVIETSQGTIHASLERDQYDRPMRLHTSMVAQNGKTGSSRTTLRALRLREQLDSYLTFAVIDLLR